MNAASSTSPPSRRRLRSVVLATLAAVLCSGCFSGMAVLGNISFSDSGNSYRGPDLPGAIVLDIVTAPVQIAALAGYLLVKGAVDVADAVVSIPEDIRRGRIRDARSAILRDSSCVTNAVYIDFDGDRLTPEAEAFAEVLGWTNLPFPTNVVEGAVERLRADPRAIPAFAKVFARRELGAAALEDLFPTVVEWHAAWSRDCGRFYLSNPNLPPGVLSRIVADPEMPADLNGLARNRMRGRQPGEAAEPPRADDLAAALALDPTLALKDPVFWDPGNQAAMDAVARLLADPGIQIPEPVLYFFARNALEDVRWRHAPFLVQLFGRPELGPETLVQCVRELVAQPSKNENLDNALRSALVNPNTPDEVVSALANGPDDGPWSRTQEIRRMALSAKQRRAESPEERIRRQENEAAWKRIREHPERLPEEVAAAIAFDGGANPAPVWRAIYDMFGIVFPEDALVEAAEAIPLTHRAISRGRHILARRELGSASLERLRPVVLEWSQIEVDFNLYFSHPAMTPELAFGILTDPRFGALARQSFLTLHPKGWTRNPGTPLDELVSEVQKDPSVLLRDFRFWDVPSGPDRLGQWAVFETILPRRDIEIPERVLVLLGELACTEGFQHTDRCQDLFSRPEFQSETLASFARRYPGNKRLIDFMPALLRNPKTPPEEIRRIAEATGAVDPDIRQIAVDILSQLPARTAEEGQ